MAEDGRIIPGTNVRTMFVELVDPATGEIIPPSAGGIVDDAATLNGNAGTYYLGRANHTGTQAQSTVTNLVADLALKAPLASPALTGVPTVPTAAPGNDSAQIASTEFVMAAVAAGGGGEGGDVPVGGTTGQVLSKASATDYDTEWVTPAAGEGGGLPAGGTTNQILKKNSATDGDAGWTSAPVVTGLTTTATDSVIGTDTVDGADNKSLLLSSTDSWNNTRGASLSLYGNEYSDPGAFYLTAGLTAAYSEIVGGNANGAETWVWTRTNTGSTIIQGGLGDRDVAQSSWVASYGNTHASKPGRLELSAGSTGYISATGGLRTTETDAIISSDSTGGAHNKSLQIGAAPAAASTGGGAYLHMLGNDYGGFPGQLFLKAGSASTRMEITGGGAGGTRTTISNATGDTGDSGTLELAGGGDFSSTRGSYIISYGNEHGSKPGRLELVAGDTGYISTTGDIKTTAASTIVSTDAENKGIQFSAAPNVVDPSKGAYVYMTGASSGVPGLLQLSGGNNGYIHVHPAFSTPAGGSSATGIRLGTAGPGIYFGSGAPSVSAAKGSLYLRSDGSGTADRAYINTNGSTTWTALTTAA